MTGANCAAGTVFFYKALRDPRMTILLFGVLPATLGSIGE